ncbi:unnamed protein product, partial [Adineta ricciae]
MEFIKELTGIQLELYCTDYSASFNLAVVQNPTIIDVENVSSCEIRYISEQWRSLSLPLGIGATGEWSILSLIGLQLRSNGKYNNLPVATIISPVYILVGIPQTFIIPTIDADNDQVRCRFANDSEECAS